MKLLVWNINGLAPTVRNAVLRHGSWLGFFQEHGCDLLCLQESKVIDEKLTKELVCVDGYQSFWAVSKGKKGYSGVTTYASAAYAPLSCETDCLGAVAASQGEGRDEEGGGEEEEDLLDREGRIVVTDHQHFVLVNVYVPNAGDAPERARLPLKMRFLRALRAKCDAFVAAGREVLVVGDFNVPAEPRDMHPALGAYLTHYSQAEADELQGWSTKYTDVWRHLHPEDSSTYTVWHEKTSARAFNQGLRIDYVFCTPGLLAKVVSCEVLSAEALPPKWSDHAGILLELRDIPAVDPHPPCPHWQRLDRRFNPPNRIASLFAAGSKKRAAEQGAAAAGGGGGGAERKEKAARVEGGEAGRQAGQDAGQAASQQEQQAGSQEDAAAPAAAAAKAGARAAQQAGGSRPSGGGKGSGGGKKQAAKQQQPDPGQRTIGSFFGAK